jgi:ketosteroid isomerase-like protein/quercetin dioxygenase-like cupin family protein
MRTLTFFVAAVAVVVSSCARTVNVEQEEAALLAIDQEWSTTTKDANKFLSYFAADAAFYPQGMPIVKGESAIRQTYMQMTGIPGFALSWKPERAEVSAAGDLGITSGTYSITMNNAAGLPATENGKYVATWRKVDGSWKVVDDIGTSDAPTALSSAHVVVPTPAIKWVDPPPSVPPGAKLAVISGDPGKPEMFTIRLQFPNGYKIAPHWHPTDEHVTVLSGTFAAAMGKAWDDKALASLPAGSYAVMAATMPHYATARGATVVQVHGMGPFVLNYVNPADDPSKK